jgi:hypothetical protein
MKQHSTYINISRQLCKIKHVFFFLLTGMIGTIECLTKDGVVESIQQCVSSVRLLAVRYLTLINVAEEGAPHLLQGT